MNVALLMVEGEDASLAEVKAVFDLESESEWACGEKTRSGRVYSASGFSVTVVDVPTPRELKEAVVAFLRLCEKRGMAFESRGLAAKLSLGFTVGDSVQFVAGFEFSPAELGAFAATGIDLSDVQQATAFFPRLSFGLAI